jgi:hypothetical protein
VGRLDRLDVYRDEDFLDSYTAERYTAELPDSLLRALADAPIVPEHELSSRPPRYGPSGKGKKVSTRRRAA